MSLPNIVQHEYMPTTKSMAAQLYDLKAVIKRKYLDAVQQDNSVRWSKTVALDVSTGLESILAQHAKDDLLSMARTIEADCQKNLKELKRLRKEPLVRELAQEIVTAFSSLLGIMDTGMFQLLQKFRGRQQPTAGEFAGRLKAVDYLLRRGYLFRAQGEAGEVYILPGELQDMLDKFDERQASGSLKRNSDICTIARTTLYHYGVMQEYDLIWYAAAQYQNCQSGRGERKIAPEDWKDYRFKPNASRELVGTVVRNYVQYSSSVKVAQFTNRYGDVYCHHTVFDPYNIYFAQRQADEVAYLPLAGQDLIRGKLQDKQVKDNMVKYMLSRLRFNRIHAEMLTEEWSSYVKNGENPVLFTEHIFGRNNFASFDQLKQLLAFASASFMNDLNNWSIKGNTPKALRRMSLSELRIAAEDPAEAEAPGQTGVKQTAKAGRNDPCPCGSGKKYKKCCGK